MAIKYLDAKRIRGSSGVSEVEQLVGGSNQTVMTNGNESHYGIFVGNGSALIGKKVNSIAFNLKMGADPSTENKVYCRLWRGDAFIHTFGEADPDDINVSSYEWHTFGTGGDDDAGNGLSVALQEDDRIVLSWDRVSGNSFWLGIEYSSSNQYDGTATGTSTVTGNITTPVEANWSDNTGRDVVFKLHGVDEKATLLTAGYKAATFDGINDWALSAGSLGITSGTSYCFGGWFYPQAQPESTGMAMWVSNVLLYRYGGRFVTEGNGTHITSTATYADNTWHHFVVNVDSSTATLYIDGANANTSDSDTITGSYTINKIQVGKEGTSTVSEYKGSASDVFVFTRALTAAEIASLSGGAKVSSISQTSIQANYTFDSDFNDSSGNSGRNLTASGNATAGNSVGTSPISLTSILPENTIFEETDTRKAYFLQSAAWLRAKVKSTFEENFDDNDASWQTSGSGASKGLGSHNGSGESGGTMVWVSTHTSGQNPVYTLDLTSLSDITTVASDWTLRFKFIDIVDNSSTANYGSFGVTAGTSNALTSEHHAVCSIGGNEMTLSARNNTHIEPSTGNSIENTAGGNEVRYVEIKSDSGIYTLNVYNNSDYSDTPSTMSTTVSLTGLRYLKLNGKGSNSGYLHVGIDDVEFYDGVVL